MEIYKLKEIEENKGITMISLVIMVIVLLIIASVSMAMVTGDNGIINRTNNSTKSATDSSMAEAIMSAQTPYNSVNEFLNYLNSKGYIKQKDDTNKIYILNASKVLGTSKSDFGDGNDGKDVYQIQEESGKWYLNYIDKTGNKKQLADLTI